MRLFLLIAGLSCSCGLALSDDGPISFFTTQGKQKARKDPKEKVDSTANVDPKDEKNPKEKDPKDPKDPKDKKDPKDLPDAAPSLASQYGEIVLKDESALVRKRAVLILDKMDMAESKDAIPELLQAAMTDRSKEIRALAYSVVEKFTTPVRIEAMLKALRSSEQDLNRRKLACLVMTILYFHPKAETENKADIYKGLEDTVADANAELRLAAAAALETIDKQKKSIAGEFLTLRINFEENSLKAIKLAPDDVTKALKEQFPKATFRSFAGKHMIFFPVAELGKGDIVNELGNARIFQRGEDFAVLRDVANIQVEGETPEKKGS